MQHSIFWRCIRYDRGTIPFLCSILICLLCWRPTIYHYCYSYPILLANLVNVLLSLFLLFSNTQFGLFFFQLWYHYVMILIPQYYNNKITNILLHHSTSMLLCYYVTKLLCYYVTMLLCCYVTMLLCYFVTQLLCGHVATFTILLCYYVINSLLIYYITILLHYLYD